MSKLDVEKEIIAFLTKLFFGLGGVAVLIVGGLLSLYISQNQSGNLLLWLGAIAVLIISAVCFVLMQHIRNHIRELERL